MYFFSPGTAKPIPYLREKRDPDSEHKEDEANDDSRQVKAHRVLPGFAARERVASLEHFHCGVTAASEPQLLFASPPERPLAPSAAPFTDLDQYRQAEHNPDDRR
ncbi:MAG: hypothetical protein M3177_00660 [Pseudomonadota bacterium]|nr:hypothetical protein [Pseudomonadota bacterium]